MSIPRCEFLPEGETEIRILFDLRIPGSTELIHRERAAWQEDSEIEALDSDHFVLIIRAAWRTRLAA
jgi:hypothetical protein